MAPLAKYWGGPGPPAPQDRRPWLYSCTHPYDNSGRQRVKKVVDADGNDGVYILSVDTEWFVRGSR